MNAYDAAEFAYKNGYSAGLKEKHLNWISVNEMLPEDDECNKDKSVIQCLVSVASTYPNGKASVQKRQRQRNTFGNRDWVWSRVGSQRITHWMYLPEPPQSTKRDNK